MTQSVSRTAEATPNSDSHLFERINDEHEQLLVVLDLARRCAANADRGDCAKMLQRALIFLEQHSRGEENLLTRCSYTRVHGVRRDHERLIIALEQALTALEGDRAGEVPEILRRVGEFLANSTARDSQSMARFFMAMLPCRLPAGAI